MCQKLWAHCTSLQLWYIVRRTLIYLYYELCCISDFQNITQQRVCGSVFISEKCVVSHKSCLRPTFYKKKGVYITWKRGATIFRDKILNCQHHEKLDVEICCSKFKLTESAPCLPEFKTVQKDDILVVESPYTFEMGSNSMNFGYFRTHFPVMTTFGKLGGIQTQEFCLKVSSYPKISDSYLL